MMETTSSWKPLLVTLLALMLAIASVAYLILGFILMTSLSGSITFLLGFCSTAFGIFLVILAHGIYRHKPWARWTTIVVGLVLFSISVLFILTDRTWNPSVIFYLVVSMLTSAYLLFSPRVKHAFHPTDGDSER